MQYELTREAESNKVVVDFTAIPIEGAGLFTSRSCKFNTIQENIAQCAVAEGRYKESVGELQN